MLVVVFLPGGMMEGFRRLARLFRSKPNAPALRPEAQPAE